MKTDCFSRLGHFFKLSAASLLFGGALANVPAHADESLPPREDIPTPTSAFARNDEIRHETKRLREAQDFAGLEALADQLRQSKEALDGGTWLLTTFYEWAVYVPNDEPKQQLAMDFYERWARENPESVTAQICLARALTRYAWNARGSGWAKSVSDEGWRLFGHRLDRAWDVLQRAEKLPQKCPGWTEAAQTIALGQGWDHDEYFKMVDAAIAQEPTYGKTYSSACYYLFPRWYGETGDFEKWIAQQADRSPPAEQDWQYARLVWMADRNRMDEEMVFGPGRLDWNRIQRGFEAWLKSTPDNLMVRFEYLRLALLANDRETTRAQFDILGGKTFARMWDEPRQFDSARNFAYAGGPNPLLMEDPPPPKFPFEMTEAMQDWIQLGVRIFNGLFGGVLAGGLLLVLAIQRRRIRAGVIALIACLILGPTFGTLATVLPGAALWFYFRRKSPVEPPANFVPPSWLVLIWTVVLAGLYLGLQLVASIPAMVPLMLRLQDFDETLLTREFMISGTPFWINLSTAWICFLILLAVCRPQTILGWRDRLGLHRCAVLPAIGWTALALGGLIGGGHFFESHLDEKSKLAMKMLALGMNVPVLFFVCIVLVAPIFEELVFRGYAFSGWVQKIGVLGASLASALLFALCHFHYGAIGLLYIFFMGLLLAGLRWKTQSIYPCIALHLINNLANYLQFHFQAAS